MNHSDVSEVGIQNQVSPPADVSTALSIPIPFQARLSQSTSSAATTGGLSDWLHAFRRRWILALSLAITCGVAGAIFGISSWQPEFTPKATLQVAGQQPVVLGTSKGGDRESFDAYKRTQQELIRDRFVLIAALREPAVIALPLVKQQLDPVEWLQSQIQLRFREESEILEISLRSQDGAEATTIVNAVVDAYIKLVPDVEREERETRLASLENVQDKAGEKVRQKRSDLIKLTETLGTGDARAATLKQQIALDTYASLRKELLHIELQLMRQEASQSVQQARAEALEKMPIPDEIFESRIKGHPEYIAAAEVAAKLRQSLHRAELLAADGQARAVQNYRQELERAEKKLDEIHSLLKPALETQLRVELTQKAKLDLDAIAIEGSTLRAQSERLEKDVAKLAIEANQIGRSSVDLEMMRFDLESLEAVRREISAEVEKLRIETKSPKRVRVLSHATVPSTWDTRSRTRRIVTYGGIGFIVPLLVVCWLDTRSKKVNSAQEVSNSMGLQVIGTMPLIPPRARRKLIGDSRPNIWNSLIGESIDSIRERLISESRIKGMKVILVSSATAAEGKTTIATQLAKSFARAGHRTLLADCDLRCPSTHVVFHENIGPGLAEVLSGTFELNKAIYPTEEPDLYHLPAGEIGDLCHEQFCKAKPVVANVFSQLRDQFDIIIVDSCPILPVVDTLVVGQFVDAAIISVMRDVSHSQQVLEALTRLEKVGVPVLGAVVTCGVNGMYGSIDRYRYALPR